ncbi:diaminopimelate epimerase [Laedolimicola ammoniilytica]|uniref:Diaminopimelate epimerase n=1 Tax=Laedolimicola ammoniilytica TaxID=2981771 RepID=A0ABT2RZS9_9FIRM|nr:diaminopimelate epimerase [Laedolimicola ammoniilytica]MCU6697833.1 diaminopimelate epimerase [Laedolimicola ammoniilytica]SCI48879.1 Diaminopimelate epimerase [uncultured Clostridium sp.]
MKFTKMHGIGNDYVYMDCTKERLENPGEIARLVSDRHKGIGSDGLILIQSSDEADFEMAMYNADGSYGKMCGNGIRCVAKYVYDNGLTDKTEISVISGGAVKYLKLTVENGKVKKVRVNMGEPILKPSEIPVVGDGDKLVAVPIVVDNQVYEMTCVSMGNPHAVVFLDDVENLKIEEIGPKFEQHERFPDRVNTEFVERIDRKNLKMRVWERGSGETMACGTGACATAVAAILNGYAERDVTVHLLGGDLEISWDETDNCVYMTGPAATAFTGEFDPEELRKSIRER